MVMVDQMPSCRCYVAQVAHGVVARFDEDGSSKGVSEEQDPTIMNVPWHHFGCICCMRTGLEAGSVEHSLLERPLQTPQGMMAPGQRGGQRWWVDAVCVEIRRQSYQDNVKVYSVCRERKGAGLRIGV